VLVVVEHGDVERLLQLLLDDEALGRLDVLEVDAAEGGGHEADGLDEGVGVSVSSSMSIDVHVGEALEEDRLALHHRLGGERAEVAEAEHRGAVRDDRDEVALGRVVVGGFRMGRDLLARHRDAGGIGEAQVPLGRHRDGRVDLELAGGRFKMEAERVLAADLHSGHGALPGVRDA
jgi:hypothetical protein